MLVVAPLCVGRVAGSAAVQGPGCRVPACEQLNPTCWPQLPVLSCCIPASSHSRTKLMQLSLRQNRGHFRRLFWSGGASSPLKRCLEGFVRFFFQKKRPGTQALSRTHIMLPRWDLRANGSQGLTGGWLGIQSFHSALLLHLKRLLCAQHLDLLPQWHHTLSALRLQQYHQQCSAFPS